MSKTHWKRLVNPNYLGAYSIEDGKDLILTIKAVTQEEIVGENGRKESGMVARFVEPSKPMILNKTNAKMLQKLSKSPYVEDWAGLRIALYATTTKFGPDVVECLRVRPFIPKGASTPAQVPCADCGAFIEGFKSFSAAQIADQTTKKYGRALCTECATSAKAAAEQAQEQPDAEQLDGSVTDTKEDGEE